MIIWCMCETSLRPNQDFPQRKEEQAAARQCFQVLYSKNKSQTTHGREDRGTEVLINPPKNNFKFSFFKNFLKSIIYRLSEEQE